MANTIKIFQNKAMYLYRKHLLYNHATQSDILLEISI